MNRKAAATGPGLFLLLVLLALIAPVNAQAPVASGCDKAKLPPAGYYRCESAHLHTQARLLIDEIAAQQATAGKMRSSCATLTDSVEAGNCNLLSEDYALDARFKQLRAREMLDQADSLAARAADMEKP